MANIKELASRHYTLFTESDKQIYQILLDYSDQMQDMTITKLAKLTFSSKSSILRFVKKLGFNGFSDFKYSINWDDSRRESINEFSALTDEIRVLLNTLTTEKVNRFSVLIKEAAAICLISTGEDQYIQMKNFSRILLKKGIVSSQLQMNPNSELTKLVLDKLDKQTLVIVFSANGNSRFLIDYLEPLIQREIKIISLTAITHSWLEQHTFLNFSLNISPKNDELYFCTSGLGHLLINLLLEKADLT